MENEHVLYKSDPDYLSISRHLEKFDKEFKLLIGDYKFKEERNGERLIMEYLSKLYCSLFTLKYALDTKDSLAVSLVSKYVYEIFIDFFYIFGNDLTEGQFVKDFFAYENTPDEKDWTKVQRYQRIEIIDKTFLGAHKAYYSRLNNHAHPSIHSLFTHRKGIVFEKWIIFSSVLMVISTIIIILKHKKTLDYFKFNLEKINSISEENSQLSKKVSPSGKV